MRYMKYIYTYPYTRIAPYLIGLILGYIISYKYSISGIYKKVKIFTSYCRSSGTEVFFKKGVLRNFTKFTGKHLCQSLFFNKVAGLRPATLLKKRL